MLSTKKAINLSGKMSILGVSKIDDQVIKAVNEASKNFYLIKELYLDAEKLISEKFGAKNSFITSSATAGIVLSISAEQRKIQKEKRKLRVGLPYGHFIDYGAKMVDIIEMAGAEVVGIGSSNKLVIEDLEKAKENDIDIAMYVSSHHAVQKNHLSAKEFSEYFNTQKIPTIIDIAAEEDVWSFIKLNYDYTVLSGSKAIAAPTSGIIFTKDENKMILEELRKSIGRAMKISKEGIIGLAKAVEIYQKQMVKSEEEKNIDHYISLLKECKFKVSKTEDKLRNISRIKLINIELIDELVSKFHKNNIFAREYHAKEGHIELDLRQTSNEELLQTIEIIKEVK